MIMARGTDQLLLPVNPFFIALTLIGTLLLEMLLDMAEGGRHPAAPDLLALVLVFWNVHQPRRVGVGFAFVFGLLIDIHQGAVLGQHALAYTLLSYLAITVHRRVLWFSVPAQALHVLPVFFAGHVVALVARLAAGGMFPGWDVLLAPVFEALLWPLVVLLLLAPQRRAPDPDKNRPL